MKYSEKTMARKIAEAVKKEGGRAYYVGGCVRDFLRGEENKDIDIEVHGISYKKTEETLNRLGQCQTKGASFGVMMLQHYNIDIALPRMEKATGRGHKDFEIFVDPYIGLEKAAGRRDFTINAMMMDIITGEVLDFFDGRSDMARKLIRHVNSESFSEDPLRVFRAAQFAARFNFSVAPETVKLSRDMDVTALSKERVMGELDKVLTKAERPSLFFDVLRQMDQLSFWFPEVESLIGCKQPPVHHPEGDVYEHTMQVMDETAKVRSKAIHPEWLLISALAHDLGKPEVTEEKGGKIHAYGHEKEGLVKVSDMLSRLTTEKKLKRYVLNMTELHMRPNKMAAEGAGKKAFMKMYDRSVCPEDLNLLAMADYMGRVDYDCVDPEGIVKEMKEAYEKTECRLNEMLDTYRELMKRPYLKGEDLVKIGLAPGPEFSELLAYAHKLRLAGLSKDEQMKGVKGMLKM